MAEIGVLPERGDRVKERGLSSLINEWDLDKWKYMASGVAGVLPIYKTGKLKSLNPVDEKALRDASRFLENAIEGEKMFESGLKYIPENPLEASKNYEICFHIFLNSLKDMDVKSESFIDKFKVYKNVIDKVIKGEKFEEINKNFDEAYLFFSKLSRF